MGSIFVNKEETIDIDIWVGEDHKKISRYWTEESDKPKDLLSEEKYRVVFRKPNFRDSTMLLDLGIRMNNEGGMDLAFNEIRYRRLEMLLKSWDIKDENGNLVKITPDIVSDFSPSFAIVLSMALEKELGIEEGSYEEDEENIPKEDLKIGKALE